MRIKVRDPESGKNQELEVKPDDNGNVPDWFVNLSGDKIISISLENGRPHLAILSVMTPFK